MSSASSPSTSILIRAAGIHKSFRKGKTDIRVLNGVDLTIHEGEMIAITGASGVGKSTLLHILGTLERPTAGVVGFSGFQGNLFNQSENDLSRFRNRSLGFVFQFHYLLAEFSALENVMLPALIAGASRAVAERQAAELLQFVGLSHRLTHRPAELSGGEQQRVAIARAVILRPRLILADELTGNLDSENAKHVLDLLTQLNQSTGVAVLLVTHDNQVASKMRRTYVMKDGKILN